MKSQPLLRKQVHTKANWKNTTVAYVLAAYICGAKKKNGKILNLFLGLDSKVSRSFQICVQTCLIYLRATAFDIQSASFSCMHSTVSYHSTWYIYTEEII